MSILYIFPYNLSIYYDGMPVTTFLFIAMYSVSAVYLFAIYYFWKRKREVSGILILLPVLIAPTYSPVKVTWFLAERYLYTGTVFFAVLVSMFILYLAKKWKNQYAAYAVLSVILILFSIKTYIRNDQWQNTETLALATMKSSPLSVRPYNDVGGYYFYKGDVDTAVDWYEKGLKVVPTSGTAINNLGYIYLQYGPLIFWDAHKPESPDKDMAKQMYDNATQFMQQKADPKTVSYFLNKALVYDPTSVEYATNLADLYFNLGLKDSSKLLYSYVLKLDPNNDYAIKKMAVLSN
jgi:Tfp pilus assembly protein PilF